MDDQAREQTWREYCNQLEPLGVDPYDPEIGPGDPRYPEVQTILMEYEAATGKVAPLPLPPGWEGTPPLLQLRGLADVDEWLKDQWNSIIAEQMGGGNGSTMALDRASKTVRDAFRILQDLGLDELPERPAPPMSLDNAKAQVLALEHWVSGKIAQGWEPKEQAQVAAASSPTQKGSNRRQRGERPNNYDANILINKYLVQNPKATIVEVATVVNLSTGKVSGMDAWRKEMARRKAAIEPLKKTHRPLTRKMLETRGQTDDPGARILVEEAVWRRLLEDSDEAGRANLHGMSEDARQRLIEHAMEHYADKLAESEDRS